jgi:hypothetical protein
MDLLHYNVIDVSLPLEVIKQAFAHELIEEGQTWIDMLEQGQGDQRGTSLQPDHQRIGAPPKRTGPLPGSALMA